jgi:hypothetical protein
MPSILLARRRNDAIAECADLVYRNSLLRSAFRVKRDQESVSDPLRLQQVDSGGCVLGYHALVGAFLFECPTDLLLKDCLGDLSRILTFIWPGWSPFSDRRPPGGAIGVAYTRTAHPGCSVNAERFRSQR